MTSSRSVDTPQVPRNGLTRHVLITGGCGFIGSALVRLLLQHRPDWFITNLDALTYAGRRENLADLVDQPEFSARYRLHHASVCDPAALDAALDAALAGPTAGQAAGDAAPPPVSAVFHLAAESHVDRSLIDSRPFIDTNVTGTQVLLDAIRRADRPIRTVHVSTDEVYGSLPLDQPEDRFTEDSPLRPSSPYAASKAAADLLVLAAHHTFGLDAVVTRCSNNFGPRQFPEKVIPLFVTNLLRGEPVPLYGDGKNVRDWIHVEDHAEALLAAHDHGVAGGVYNIGADNEHANLELTHQLLHIVGRDESYIRAVPDRLGHDRRYAIDPSKTARELGWQASRSAWPEALEATARWYREHPEWWQPLRHAAAG